LYFCQAPVVKIHLQRHKSKTSLFELGFYLSDFRLVQQQYSFSGRVVLPVTGLLVWSNTGTDEPALLAIDSCV